MNAKLQKNDTKQAKRMIFSTKMQNNFCFLTPNS